MASTVLEVALVSDASRFNKGFQQAQSNVNSFSKQVDRASSGSLAKLDSSVKSAAVSVKAFVGLAAARAVGQFFGEAVRNAQDLAESANAVSKVFGEASDQVISFGQIAGKVAGLSAADFNQLAAVSGALLKNLGFDSEAAALEVVKLTTLASDMASVFNTDVSTALEAINSGLKGEADPLEQFGVKLNQAKVNAKAVELGLADTTSAVDDNAKAVATLNLLYEQTSDVAGDFIDTADEGANAQRRAAAAAENASARFGAALLPLKAGLLDMGAVVLESFAALGGDEVARASLRMDEALELIERAVADGRDEFSALADAMLHVAVNGDLTAGGFIALASAAGLGADKFGEFSTLVLAQAEALGLDAQIVEELAAAMDGAGTAAGEAGPEFEAVAEGLKNTSEFARTAAAAQREYQSALLESANPLFALARAQERAQAAEVALQEARDAGADEDEIARKILAHAEALLELEAAARAAGDPTQLLLGLQAIADAAGLSRDEVELLFTQLGLLDGFTVETFVNQTITTVERTGSQPTRSTTGRNTPRAQGGPVTAGDSYLVGERGPEMFVPNVNGRIVPNSQGFGNSITIGPFYYPPDRPSMQDIQRELLISGVARWAEVQ